MGSLEGRRDERFAAGLDAFSEQIFASLMRSDQRRWARVYLEGLLLDGGRKSIRRIAAEVGDGKCDQSLQQFLNQSPWDEQPVRRSIATTLCARRPPVAWSVHEVAFPKNGASSAGVARQYVSTLGRVSNCQLGVCVAIAGDTYAVPVNWRLMLPSAWDNDEDRRARAHVPHDERHRPPWQYIVDALDDMIGDWGVPVPPVLIEARRTSEAENLAADLTERDLDFAIEVSPSLPLLRDVSRAGRPPHLGPIGLTPAGGAIRPMAAADAFHASSAPRQTVAWHDAEGRCLRSQFAVVPVRLATRTERRGPSYRHALNLVVELGMGRAQPRSMWLTNMVQRPTEEIAQLVKVHARSHADVVLRGADVGLYDFEGRSFRGWHHHATLVSAALAQLMLHSPVGLALGMGG